MQKPKIITMLQKLFTFCLIFCLLLNSKTHAQIVKSTDQKSPEISFAKVSIDELASTQYDFYKLDSIKFDKNIAAVILYEKGISYYDFSAYSMKLVHEKHVRIKILSNDAAIWTKFEIPTYKPKSSQQNESIETLEGYTHILKDGKIIRHKLEAQDVFTTKVSKDVELTRFAMPFCEVGAVIEYRYKMTSDYIFNLQGWEFQKAIPVLWSEYEIKIPDYFSYTQFLQGYENFVVENKVDGLDYFTFNQRMETTSVTTYKWAMKNVPAFKSMIFMENPAANIARMDFVLDSFKFPMMSKRETTPTTWEAIYAAIKKDEKIIDFVKKTSELKEIVQKLTSTTVGETAKMKVLFNYVKTTIKYNGELGRNPSVKNPEKILEAKKGNFADINLLLVAMLKQADLQANPLVLAGKETGIANPKYPIFNQLNSTIATVTADGVLYYLDATQPFTTPSMLPLRCLNGNGLLLTNTPESMQNLRLVPEVESRKIIRGNLSINVPENITNNNLTSDIIGNMRVEESGYIALGSREILQNQSKEIFIQKSLTAEGEGVGMENLTIINDTLPDNNLLASVNITAYNKVVILPNSNKTKQEISFYPMLCLHEKLNPFIEKNRKFPVDFVFPFIEDYRITYTIPTGYKIKTMPTDGDFTLANGEITYRYAITQSNNQNTNQITITHLLSVSTSKILPKNYAELQGFWDKIVQKHAEKIVLEK